MITLYKYLALNKKLVLPGIGNFAIEEAAATLEFSDKLMHPPVQTIVFSTPPLPLDNHFYSFLSQELNVDKITAIRLYSQEINALKKQLEHDGKALIEGIGILQKQGEEIIFTAADVTAKVFVPVLAERVIHANATHTMRVGETEVTNVEMQEALDSANEKSTDKWWIYALILALLAIAVIAVYYGSR